MFTPEAAFDGVADWIALIDTDCVVQRVNRSMADGLGRGAGRLCDEKVVAACRRVVRRGIVDLSQSAV